MRRLVIHTLNASLSAYDEGFDYESIADARHAALTASVQIALDELLEGKSNAIVEARIEETDGTVLTRFAIALGTTDLVLG